MFPGLTAADFDCYEPRKWRSNVYNRERMEVKQRLLALGREAGGALLGLDGSPLYIEASVEHPALWNHKLVDSQSVFFSRNEAARKQLDGIIDREKPISSLLDDPTPQRNHVFLALTLSHEALEVSLKLHPDASVDRRNLERKIDDHFERERLLSLLRELPAGFTIGITPAVRPAAELGAEDLPALVAGLGHEGQRPEGRPSSGPLGGLGPLPGQAPVAHLFYVGQALPRQRALSPDMEPPALTAWAREGLAHLLPIYHFIAWSRDNDYVSIRKLLDQEKAVRRQRGLGKNDSVRIVRGMLSGKSGVIQEIDAKGQLRVLVGKLTLKIDAADVELERE